MTTPHIEEMVEEFKDKFGVTYGGQETQDEWLHTTLTKVAEEAKKSGIDEEKERIKQWVARNYRLDTLAVEMPKIMEALQDNK